MWGGSITRWGRGGRRECENFPALCPAHPEGSYAATTMFPLTIPFNEAHPIFSYHLSKHNSYQHLKIMYYLLVCLFIPCYSSIAHKLHEEKDRVFLSHRTWQRAGPQLNKRKPLYSGSLCLSVCICKMGIKHLPTQ